MADEPVSATVPDWDRETPARFWDPGRQFVRTIRRWQAWRDRGGLAYRLRFVWTLQHRFWTVVTGADVPLETRIGGGLVLPHPNGVVIHAHSILGPNCMIFQQVTLGVGGKKPGAPVLGGHVDIGAGAKLLGGVHVGDHAKIGANAVVLDDVPPGATAVGIPARIIPPAGQAVNSRG